MDSPSFMNLFKMDFCQTPISRLPISAGPPQPHVNVFTDNLFASTIVRPMPLDINNGLPSILLEF